MQNLGHFCLSNPNNGSKPLPFLSLLLHHCAFPHCSHPLPADHPHHLDTYNVWPAIKTVGSTSALPPEPTQSFAILCLPACLPITGAPPIGWSLTYGFIGLFPSTPDFKLFPLLFLHIATRLFLLNHTGPVSSLLLNGNQMKPPTAYPGLLDS